MCQLIKSQPWPSEWSISVRQQVTACPILCDAMWHPQVKLDVKLIPKPMLTACQWGSNE